MHVHVLRRRRCCWAGWGESNVQGLSCRHGGRLCAAVGYRLRMWCVMP
jgi:hypothetical protein